MKLQTLVSKMYWIVTSFLRVTQNNNHSNHQQIVCYDICTHIYCQILKKIFFAYTVYCYHYMYLNTISYLNLDIPFPLERVGKKNFKQLITDKYYRLGFSRQFCYVLYYYYFINNHSKMLFVQLEEIFRCISSYTCFVRLTFYIGFAKNQI